MQTIALIVIRLLGTLCGLWGLFQLSAAVVFEFHHRQRVDPSGSSGNLHSFAIILNLGVAALGFYTCWLVWRRLSPMTVRRLSFVIGLVVWWWIAWKAEDIAVQLWSEAIGLGFLWPIAIAVTAGCLFSYSFRRALFPVVTPSSRAERFVRRLVVGS